MANNTGTACASPPAEYQYYLFPTVYICALVLGLPGNLVALYVFSRRTKPRTAFSVYISCLALANMLILCTLPFRLHYHLNGNKWAFGEVACCLTGILFFINIYMSVCFMTCICVDRYLAAVHPHKYLRMRSLRRSLVVSLLLWCLAGVAGLVFVLLGPLRTNDRGSVGGSCFENFAESEWTTRLAAYSVLGLVFGSLLPSVVMLVCYPLAAGRISKIGTRTAQRAVRIIYAILTITVLCFLPYHLVYLLHLLRRLGLITSCPSVRAIYTARHVTMALVTLNTCLDPLVYLATTGRCGWRRLRVAWLWRRTRRSRQVYNITLT